MCSASFGIKIGLSSSFSLFFKNLCMIIGINMAIGYPKVATGNVQGPSAR